MWWFSVVEINKRKKSPSKTRRLVVKRYLPSFYYVELYLS